MKSTAGIAGTSNPPAPAELLVAAQSRSPSSHADAAALAVQHRLPAIDALRGVVLLLMLVDHSRDLFFQQHPIADPMDILALTPGLFFTRLSSALCAPIFIFLAGLAANLYARSHGNAAARVFLLKRGLLLLALEFTLVDFAWSGEFPAGSLDLQVIGCIGICMLALAALLGLPRAVLATLAAVIVLGHNLLDGVAIEPGSSGYALWSLLHQRNVIELGTLPPLLISYPVLPWIGAIVLGFCAGPWYTRSCAAGQRIALLLWSGCALLAAFVLLRWLNFYGDAPWLSGDDALRTLMSFLNATKYPPSLMFLLPTLGMGLLLLALFERCSGARLIRQLAQYGAAPLFFYLAHLYALQVLYRMALQLHGPTQGESYGVAELWQVWALSGALALALFWPTRWFARLKQRRRDLRWLGYF